MWSRVHGQVSGVRRRLSAIALAMMLAFVSPLSAQNDARRIVEEAQRRAESKSQRYEGLLQVLDNKGKVADKRWLFMRIGSHGRSKAVLRFLAPPEVKGVALLIVNHPDRASDQWMWTPALQRERRIALQDRSTRFFGTDFSFEDLEERDVDQYNYRLIGEEALDGVPCWRVESTPSQKKISQYTKAEVWVRKDNFAFAQVESYIKADVVRRLKYSDFVQVQGIWTARRLEMIDLRRKSRTILTLEKLEYNIPLKDDDFTLQALRNPS
ncbi:MAG: outer membrane lipoprotein-sorting protein [Vicinamibacterales bacterium]